MSFQPPRPSSVLASVLCAAGIMLTAASCSHLTPLGPPDTGGGPRSARTQVGPPVAVPRPSQLGSPIMLQVMHSVPGTPAGSCPVGSVAVAVPPGAAPMGCYRAVGTPVTINLAGISAVAPLPQPPPPPGQSAGPTQYGFFVVPGANVAAVTALIAQAHASRDALGVSVEGKLWEAPQVLAPFSGQQLQLAFISKTEALQLYRILIPSG